MPLLQLVEPTYGSKIKKQKPPFEFKNVKVTDLYFCPYPVAREKLKVIKNYNVGLPRSLFEDQESRTFGSGSNQIEKQMKIAKDKGKPL